MDPIVQFCAVTGASADYARKYLKFADNNLDMAVVLFFESGEPPEPQQAVKQPPYVLYKQEQPQPQPQKKGFFGIGSKKQEKPAPAKEYPPVREKPAPAGGNYHYFKPTMDSVNEQFNDGGVREGGSATAVYKKKESDFPVQIDIYPNGFAVNGEFFSFDEPYNRALLEEMYQKNSLPYSVFDRMPSDKRPYPNQKVVASVRYMNTPYKADGPGSSRAQAAPTFDPKEKGRVLGGDRNAGHVLQQGTAATAQANLDFELQGCGAARCRVRVRADQTFTVTCDPAKHTINDILNGIRKNGGLATVKDVKQCYLKSNTGQVYEDGRATVGKAGLAGKSVNVMVK